jgi:AcrR family transcriptional regulator
MTAAPLPRGPHSLGREAVRDSQRRRMLDAVTAAVAEKGFGATVVADVVSRAGVSRKTFYEHFTDRDDCFMAAYEDGLAELQATMAEAVLAASAVADPVVWLRASIRSYLGFLAERPALARTFVLEVLAAGPAALARRAAAYEEFATVTRAWHERARAVRPQYPDVPERLYLAVVGAGHGLVAEEVRQGRSARLAELEPLLLHVHLALLADARTVGRSLKENAQR